MSIKKRRPIRLRGSDVALVFTVYAAVTLLMLLIVIPFLIIFFQSVTPNEAMLGSHYSIVPRNGIFPLMITCLSALI